MEVIHSSETLDTYGPHGAISQKMATFKVSAFSSWYNIISIDQQLMYHFCTTLFSWAFLVAYSKAELRSSGERASPCFKPFWIRKLSDKCIYMEFTIHFIQPYVNEPNSMGTLTKREYSTSLLTNTGIHDLKSANS
jgi:hypothetical protein